MVKSSGLTQRVIAQKAGINPVYLNRWLTGKRTLSEENAKKVASVLGVDITNIARKLPDDADIGNLPELQQMEAWKERALRAEAKLAHLQRACNALGQHVSALGMTVDDFSKIISG